MRVAASQVSSWLAISRISSSSLGPWANEMHLSKRNLKDGGNAARHKALALLHSSRDVVVDGEEAEFSLVAVARCRLLKQMLPQRKRL